MAVELKKGGRVNLTKDTGLKRSMIGLGWDTNRYQGSAEFDLDLVIFECDKNKRCMGDQHMVYYHNLEDSEKAIKHSGDNRTGVGDGDDETALVNFANIHKDVETLVIAVTIYAARERQQNFGLVDNAFIRMVNPDKNDEEILRFDLSEDFSTQTSVVFAEIYKVSGEWKFRAIGEGYNKELEDLCYEYGLEVLK